jgi:predicted dehydrogenase
MKKYNIGLLGFGNMGKTHHYSVYSLRYFYRGLPFDAEIKAVCTATAASAEAARQFGVPFATTNEDDLINDPGIDIIDISTPNIYHYGTIKKAIAAGKHIYCEKPLCVTYAEAAEVAALARSAGITCQVVFNVRGLAPIQRAKQLIDEGRLGRLLSFRSSYLHSSCTDTNKNAGWKQNRDICGGGVLFDLGSHAIDLVYYLCGTFSSVSGLAQIAYPVRRGMDGADWHTNADEAFYMTARLDCGACGTVEASKIAPGTNDDLRLEIYGEKGSIRFDLMEPNWLYYYDAGAHAGSNHNTDLGGMSGYIRIECVGRYAEPAYPLCGVKAPVGWLRSHVGSYYNFLDALHNGRPASPSFDDAAHVQWVMEEAYRTSGIFG